MLPERSAQERTAGYYPRVGARYGSVHSDTRRFHDFLGVYVSANSFEEENRAFLEKADQLRAIAATTESGAAQKIYLLLADSYEMLAGHRTPTPKFDREA